MTTYSELLKQVAFLLKVQEVEIIVDNLTMKSTKVWQEVKKHGKVPKMQ